MSKTQKRTPSGNEIVRTVGRIRKSWSDAERAWRKQVGEFRRQQLMLLLEPASQPQPVRVAN